MIENNGFLPPNKSPVSDLRKHLGEVDGLLHDVLDMMTGIIFKTMRGGSMGDHHSDNSIVHMDPLLEKYFDNKDSVAIIHRLHYTRDDGGSIF